MQNALATLLLITAAVSLCAIVVDYVVVTGEQTLQPSASPLMQRIQDLNNSLVNQTLGFMNDTAGLPPSEIGPQP
jgi:hypothetical protein